MSSAHTPGNILPFICCNDLSPQSDHLQIVLEFPEVFWDDNLSYFGAALPGGPAGRGAACIFWNLHPLTGSPQLTALVSGDAAYRGEGERDEQLRDMAVGVLRTVFGEGNVPDPTGVSVTRWLSDEYSRGKPLFWIKGCLRGNLESVAINDSIIILETPYIL